MSDIQKLAHHLLAEDHAMVSYRPSWNKITGSVNATILLQQVRFRWINHEYKPFYKFFAPPKQTHPAYKPNDSWCEELGFTLSELQGAIKRIAKRLTTEDIKNLPQSLDGYFFGYYRDQQHKTWHYFNEAYFLERIVSLYTSKQDSPNEKFPSGKSPNGKTSFSQIGNSNVAKSEIPISIHTEITTETTTDKNGASAPPSGKSNLQKENPAGRRKKDPTTSDQPPASPPAIEAYRQIARTYPEKSLWPMITQAVGEKPEDLVFWQEIVTNYIACGWNKRNVKAMLQFFTNRRIPSTQPVQAQASQQNGRSKLPPGVSSQEELDQALARFQAEEAKEKGLS